MNHKKRIGTMVLAGAVSVLAFSADAAVPTDVAYITNQGGNVSVVDAKTFKPIGQIAVGTSPRGVAITPDGRWLLTANQGDSDVSVVDTATSKEVKRIKVGKNVEFLRIIPGGGKAFVTYEPSSTGGPEKPGAKDNDADERIPAEVAVIDLKRWKVVGRMKASPETEGIEFSADRKFMIVSNEGDDTLGVYQLSTLKQIKRIDLSSSGSRPRGLKISPDGKNYVVTMENSNNFLLLDSEFKVIKSVPTEQGPYGVAFDKDGSHLWIAAARAGRLQVFDAKTLASAAAIPVGKRCWHFSFTPDGKNVLLACGRSNDIEVIDAGNYQVVNTLSDFKLPWGVVTYPKSEGSVDAPEAP